MSQQRRRYDAKLHRERDRVIEAPYVILTKKKKEKEMKVKEAEREGLTAVRERPTAVREEGHS